MTKEWSRHQQTIVHLYKGKNMTLHDVRQVMEQKHGFQASIRAFRSKLRKWQIYKYNRRNSAPMAPYGAGLFPGSSHLDLDSSGMPCPLAKFHPKPMLDDMTSPRLLATGDEHALAMGFSLGQAQPDYSDHALAAPLPPFCGDCGDGGDGMRAGAFAIGYLSGGYAPLEHAARLLFDAVQQGNAAQCQQIVLRCPGIVHARDGQGRTPLHLATSWEVIRCLLTHSADAAAVDAGGDTLLHRLLRHEGPRPDDSWAAAVKTLVDRTDVDLANARGETPLVLLADGLQQCFDRVWAQALEHALAPRTPRAKMPVEFAPPNPFPSLVDAFLRRHGADAQAQAQAAALATPPPSVITAYDGGDADAGEDPALEAVCRCLQALLGRRGASPDLVLRGRPLLHHFLDPARHAVALGPLWPLVHELARRADPALEDAYGNNALQAAFDALRALGDPSPDVLDKMRKVISALGVRPSRGPAAAAAAAAAAEPDPGAPGAGAAGCGGGMRQLTYTTAVESDEECDCAVAA